MLVTFLHSLPLVVLFFALLVPILLLGLGGLWVVRRQDWMVQRVDNDAIPLTHAFVGVLYAVALGLMVFNVQSGYTEVKLVVMQEANLAGDLYIDAVGLSEPIRSTIQSQTREYLTMAVAEWPDIGTQLDSDLPSHDEVESLALTILSYEPTGDKELVIYGEVTTGLNDLLDSRRERLHLGRDGVGSVTWVVVCLGALITIGLTWFYRTESARAHYLLVALMSCMFGLMIFLIVAMDHPLLGQFRVDSSPFTEALQDIEAWRQHFQSGTAL